MSHHEERDRELQHRQGEAATTILTRELAADHLDYGPVCGQREAGQRVGFDRGTTWETGKRRDGL